MPKTQRPGEEIYYSRIPTHNQKMICFLLLGLICTDTSPWKEKEQQVSLPLSLQQVSPPLYRN